MNAARQAIRWSIPGWLLICSVASFQALTEIMLDGGAAFGPLATAITLSLVAAFTAGGLPLGFLMYQAYHTWYGSILPFDIVGHDRGAEVLMHLPSAALKAIARETGAHPDVTPMTVKVRLRWFPNSILRLMVQYRTPAGRERYRRRQQHNWELTRFFLNVVILRQQHSSFKDDFQELSDVYHAIGASRFGILLAYLIYTTAGGLIQVEKWGTLPIHMMLAWVTVSLLTMVILWTLERNRRRTQICIIMLLQFAFHWHARQPKTRARKQTRRPLPANQLLVTNNSHPPST